MRARARTVAAALATAAAVAGAGCGSAGVAELPPPAGPAEAPPATRAPAGRLVSVGGPATGVTLVPPAARVAAVTVRRPPGLVLVDLDAGRVLRTVRLPGPPARPAAGGNGTALVPVGAGGRLLRVRGRDGRVLAAVRVGAAPRAAVGARAGAVVADAAASTLSLVAGGRVMRTAPTPAAPSALAATADGRLIAVVAGRARVLALHDAATLRRLGAEPAGVGPTSVAVHGDRAYVADTVGGAVLEYRLRPELRFARRIGIRGGPYGIAADPARERLWVTLTARNELVEIPMRRPRIVRRFPTVRAPDGVAVDPSSGRVLVAGSASGQLQIVDP